MAARFTLALLAATATASYIAPTSEAVTLREPPEPPPSGTPRTNCPHSAQGLSNWHDVRTWASSNVPAAGAAVTLPPSTHVLITRSPGLTFGLITVPASSSLIIGENATHGIELDATGIHVLGSLRAGSASCRLNAAVTITLHGGRPSNPHTLQPSAKGIHVAGSGILDLHGKQYHRTWTRLARRVEPGERYVYLQRPVNWLAGMEVQSQQRR